MTALRTPLLMAFILVLGLGTGTVLRRGLSSPARPGPGPAARPEGVLPRTRPLAGTLQDALARELLPDGRDSVIVAAIRARDCLTCEDLGRQLRELTAAAGDGMRVVIAMPASDSARVREFVRTERIRNVHLAVYRQPLKLQDGTDVPTPAAFVLDRDGRVRRGIAHLEREANVRTVSFAQELGYLPMKLVPPQVDSSPERTGRS